MLVGRDSERARIEHLIDDARNGHGGAVVIRGEAGIGKTALLEHATDVAHDFRILRALGVENEAELPFAGLHELLRPVVHLIDELPIRQAEAMKTALALGSGTTVDRFAILAGTFGLLAAAGAEEPLLCLVDDAQWLDAASAEAIVFAARRVQHDPIALVLAAREPDRAGFAAPGLAELRLEGLVREDARALVADRAPTLTPAAVERLLDTAGGNPLALLEFAHGTADYDAAGEPLRVGALVERAFVERAASLSAGARRALLLVAASDQRDPDALWAALELEGIDNDALAESERAGLLVSGATPTFSHPLARSALYHAAAPAERRAVHRSLAAVANTQDRRAWHLAGAASGPDEEVATALEEAAATASDRGGASAQAAALERSAQLSPAGETGARRLFRAALAAEAGGELAHAERLLAETARLTSDEVLRADAIARWSYLLFDRGELEQAIDVAEAEADGANPAIAARVLISGGAVYALLHQLDIPAALTTAERAARLAGGDTVEDLDLCHILAWTSELSGRTEDARRLAESGVQRAERGTILAIDFAIHFGYLEDYRRALQLLQAIVEHERNAVALGNLAYALDALCHVEARAGRLTAAYTTSLEAVQLTEPLGNDVALGAALAWLSLIEAMVGRAEAHAHGMRSLAITQSRGDRWNEVQARAALGLNALAGGDLEAAVGWLEPAAEMLDRGSVRQPNHFRVQGDLIEAQPRRGERDQASRHLARLLEDAALTASPWALAVGARCQALLAPNADVDEAFARALELHERDASDWELARTQLLYGERLRRLRRRRDAREQLYAALDTLDRVGARPWADRARAELRATGQRLRRRGPAAGDQLTPQELQISLAAAEGLTNKEIAARLILSPKTVEFHLSGAYRKLNVRSRGELIKLFAEHRAANQVAASGHGR
jgi:DNA-binding CsgD family transcriptional regulator